MTSISISDASCDGHDQDTKLCGSVCFAVSFDRLLGAPEVSESVLQLQSRAPQPGLDTGLRDAQPSRRIRDTKQA